MLSGLPELAVCTQLGGEVEGCGSTGKLFSPWGQGTECGHTRWPALGLVKEDPMDLNPSAWQSGRDRHRGDTTPAGKGEVSDRARLLNGDTAGTGGQG